MAEAVVKKIYPERSETAEAKTKPEGPASRPSEIGGLNQKLPTSRRNRVRWILFGLLPIVLIAGGLWYILGGAIMSTDNSYVDAEKVGISTDVAGIVQTVEVKDKRTRRMPDKFCTGWTRGNSRSLSTAPRPIWRRYR